MQSAEQMSLDEDIFACSLSATDFKLSIIIIKLRRSHAYHFVGVPLGFY